VEVHDSFPQLLRAPPMYRVSSRLGAASAPAEEAAGSFGRAKVTDASELGHVVSVVQPPSEALKRLRAVLSQQRQETHTFSKKAKGTPPQSLKKGASGKRKVCTNDLAPAPVQSVRMRQYIDQGIIPDCGLKRKRDATGSSVDQNPSHVHSHEHPGVGVGVLGAGEVGSLLILNMAGTGNERTFPPSLSREPC
jgi:hypothetical protein